jgi:hypothetical protein
MAAAHGPVRLACLLQRWLDLTCVAIAGSSDGQPLEVTRSRGSWRLRLER